MKTETLADTTKKVRTALSDIKVRDFSDSVKERCKDTYEAAQRGVRRMRAATEKGIEETRHSFKSHPIRFITVIACAAFILGGATGWAVAKTRRS
jgi:hypothetical protein